jgi:hypothetical protein
MAEDMPPSGSNTAPLPVPQREPTPSDGQGAADGTQVADRGRVDVPPSGGGR